MAEEKINILLNHPQQFTKIERKEYDEWFQEVKEYLPFLSLKLRNKIDLAHKKVNRRINNKAYAKQNRNQNKKTIEYLQESLAEMRQENQFLRECLRDTGAYMNFAIAEEMPLIDGL